MSTWSTRRLACICVPDWSNGDPILNIIHTAQLKRWTNLRRTTHSPKSLSIHTITCTSFTCTMLLILPASCPHLASRNWFRKKFQPPFGCVRFFDTSVLNWYSKPKESASSNPVAYSIYCLVNIVKPLKKRPCVSRLYLPPTFPLCLRLSNFSHPNPHPLTLSLNRVGPAWNTDPLQVKSLRYKSINNTGIKIRLRS